MALLALPDADVKDTVLINLEVSTALNWTDRLDLADSRASCNDR
tara:strand:- start:33 stop:164 length:132 start_codon:yes stop_codon:yes gene_type:complete